MAAISSGSGSSGRWLLHPQDGLLSEQDQDLPFGRHVVGAMELIQIIERLVACMPVRSEEVVVGDPEGDAVVCAIEVVITAGSPIGSLEGAVHPFDHLLERAELSGDGILVGQSDDLGNVEFEVLAVVEIDLLGSKRIGGVAVGDETEMLRELPEVLQGHTHGKDAGADTTVRRDTVTEDGTGACIHDEPDEAFDASDLDVGLITDHVGRGLVIVSVYEGLDDKSSGPGIVGDLLVRDAYAIEIIHGLGCLAKRQLQVDMKGQTKGHDVGIVFGEIQRRSILRKGRDVHFEEVDIELPIDVVEFVSVLLKRMLFIDFLQILAVIGALVVDTLVDTKTGSVLDRDQSMAAVRALVFDRFGMDTAVDEGGAADLALVLAVTAIVVVKIVMQSTADRTDLVHRNRAAASPLNRFELLAILVFVVCDEELPVLFEERDDERKLVDPELLVLRRSGIIMDPLVDGDEFTDKLQQKCDLFGLMLNDVKKIEYNVHEQLDPFEGEFCSKNIVPEKG